MKFNSQKIISKVDLENAYAIGDTLVLPINIDINNALRRQAKYIKVCMLPKEVDNRALESNVCPRQIVNYQNVNNKKNISFDKFSNNKTSIFNKKLLSKHAISTGQSEYKNQEIFISADEILVNNSSLKINTFIDLKIAEDVLAILKPQRINKLTGEESLQRIILPHFFTISILNKDKLVLDFEIIEQSNDINIEDYRIDNIDFENRSAIISQYLETFADTVSFVFNKYTFDNSPNKTTIDGPYISYNLNTLSIIESLINSEEFSESSLYSENIVYFRIDILGHVLTSNVFNTSFNSYVKTDFKFDIANKLIENAELSDGIRKYFYDNENADVLDFSISVTSSLTSNLITRNASITRQEAIQYYSDYEFKNKSKILQEKLSNNITFENLFNDLRQESILKITLNNPDKQFLDTTSLLENLNLSFKLIPSANTEITIDKLFLSSKITEDNFINSTNNVFSYNTLFNRQTANIFYFIYLKQDVTTDFTNSLIKAYAGETLINESILNDSNNNQNDDILDKESNYFNLTNVLNDSIQIVDVNEGKPIIAEDNKHVEFKFTNKNNIISSLNLSGLTNVDENFLLTKIYSDMLFEIKVLYTFFGSGDQANSTNEFVYYAKAVDLYNSETDTFILRNRNSDLQPTRINCRKEISIKSIILGEGHVDALITESTSSSVKDSMLELLNQLNPSLFSFYIQKFENVFFRVIRREEYSKIYKDLFRVFENKSLNFFSATKENTIQSSQENTSQNNSIGNRTSRRVNNRNIVNSISNRNILNLSYDIIDECLDYKKSDILGQDFDSNLLFEIKDNNSILLKKKSISKKYNLSINIDKYDFLKNINTSHVEIVHHINLSYYKSQFSDDSSNENVSEKTFLTNPSAIYINKNFYYEVNNNNLLIKSSDREIKNLGFEKNYYNECLDYWDLNSQGLLLNFILEKYVIKIQNRNGDQNLYSVNNIIPANDISKDYIIRYSVTQNRSNYNKLNNFGIRLDDINLFKPSFNILYN